MIDIQQTILIHKLLIEQFGGASGLRDKDGLEAALARPFQTFDSQELYPSAIDKAAAIIQSIVTNHPFIDGNKRTGYVIMRLILMENQLDILADEDEKYAFVIQISEGKLNIDQIKNWINRNLKK
jgi:death-on-curing protein